MQWTSPRATSAERSRTATGSCATGRRSSSRPCPRARPRKASSNGRAAPDAVESWSVYADWLTSHGDVRGEIAALRQQGRVDEARLLAMRHAATLLPASGVERVTWRHGFVAGVKLRLARDAEPVQRLRSALATPLLRLADTIELEVEHARRGELARLLDALADAPQAATLRGLRLRDLHHAPGDEIRSDFAAWSLFPALESLAVSSNGIVELGVGELPLRRLVRISPALHAEELADLARLRLPLLVHLELWLGHAYEHVTVPTLSPLLDGDGFPALAHLGIVNSNRLDDVIPALATCRLLPRLRSLDLSRGTLGRRGADLLIDRAAAFTHLGAIDVTDNLLAEADVARLRATFPHVTSTRQREREVLLDEDDEYIDEDSDEFESVAYIGHEYDP